MKTTPKQTVFETMPVTRITVNLNGLRCLVMGGTGFIKIKEDSCLEGGRHGHYN